MKPEKVISPKRKIKDVYFIFEQKTEGFSLATMKYGESVRIGIRWNGKDDELGYPQSNGYATWFILPKSVAISYAKKIDNPDMIKAFSLADDDSFI